MSEDLNMSIRKFLKQVGVTSQQEIENAIRNSTNINRKSLDAKVVLTIDEIGLEHIVKGKIEG